MKNRICFFLPEISGGGAERVVCELSAGLANLGYPVTIMLLQDRKRAYAVDPKVEILQLPSGKNAVRKIIGRVRRIRAFLKKDPDCVFVSFLYRPLVYAMLATRGLPNRWIVSERNNPETTPPGAINRRVRNMGFWLADACVFQTEGAKAYFHKRVQKKGVVIPNPIPDIQPKRIPNQSGIIMNACRLSSQKNLPLLLRAFAEVHRMYPRCRLKLYGEGPERAHLTQLVQDMGLSEFVELPGFARDIHSCYRDAELFVSSSDYEGISNTMLEAMGIGLPVICTDCPVGGAGMMIRHGENGLLVPVGDEKAMAQAILRLMEDKQLAETMAKRAVADCEAFSLDRITHDWEAVITANQR